MRKITELATKAFWNGENFSLDNTTAKTVNYTYIGDISYLYLHNNLIAKLENRVLTLSSCGWKTNTTKERLNGVLLPLCKKIYQVKGKWYLHDGNDGSEVPFYDGITLRLGA